MMAEIKLVGTRERLIQGKWTLPGEVVTVPDKALPLLVDRLGSEIEVTQPLPETERGEMRNDDETGRIDGKAGRRSSGSRRNSKR